MVDEKTKDERNVEKPEQKEKEKKNNPKDSGMYKGYDIKWLKSEPKHPDYKLVAEYEHKFGKIK